MDPSVLGARGEFPVRSVGAERTPADGRAQRRLAPAAAAVVCVAPEAHRGLLGALDGPDFGADAEGVEAAVGAGHPEEWLGFRGGSLGRRLPSQVKDGRSWERRELLAQRADGGSEARSRPGGGSGTGPAIGCSGIRGFRGPVGSLLERGE